MSKEEEIGLDTENDDLFEDSDLFDDNNVSFDDDFLEDEDDKNDTFDDDFLEDDSEKEESFDDDFLEDNEPEDLFESSEEEDVSSASEDNDVFSNIEKEETKIEEPIEQEEPTKQNIVQDESNDDEDDDEEEEEVAAKPQAKQSNSNGSDIKKLIVAMGVASVVSISTSWFLFGNTEAFSDLGDLKIGLLENTSTINLLENKLKETSAAVSNSKLANKAISDRSLFLEEQIEELRFNDDKSKATLQKMISVVVNNRNDLSEVNKALSKLPKSNTNVAQRIVELEAKLKEMGSLKYLTSTLGDLKKAVKNQQASISGIQRDVKKNLSNITKTKRDYQNINKKALKNAQSVAENRKGIRNNGQRIAGEASVKDLLKQSQSASKEVRAVSLLFDNDKTVEVQDYNKTGYYIVGSIDSVMFYIEEVQSNGKKEIITYSLSDNLPGYGIITEIKENGFVNTESGVVKNTNKK
jgi:hypothetical protein